jgi:hypothetical protein
MDGSGDTFPELARVADRGESAHHELSKITEIGNAGEASTANRSQQMSYHGVFIRFGKEEWQVRSACRVRRLAFGVWRSAYRHGMPEGRNDRSLAIYCREWDKSGSPLLAYRSIGSG